MNDSHSSRKLSRRGLLKSGGLATASLVAACAPVAPAPSPAEPSLAGGGWEAEWEALIAAAKKEGKVVVQTAIGVGYRNMLEAFGKAFPGIEPEQQAFPDSNSFVTKVTAERQAGIYTYDIASTTVTAMWQVFKPQGFIDPIRPVLFRPDVLDDNAWYGGLSGRFVDITRTHIFRNTVYVLKPVYLNTDLVKPEEVTTLDDLLDPKWKGQIITSDGSQGARLCAEHPGPRHQGRRIPQAALRRSAAAGDQGQATGSGGAGSRQGQDRVRHPAHRNG